MTFKGPFQPKLFYDSMYICACESSDGISLPCELCLMRIAGGTYKCGMKPTCMQGGSMEYLLLNLFFWQ